MNQTVADALGRIRGAIDGKSRDDFKVHADDGKTVVHVCSHAEADPNDIIALCNALPPDVVKGDKRLQAIRFGSLNAGIEIVALKVVDLEYLVAAVDKAAAPPAPVQSTVPAPAGQGKPA